MLAIFSVLICEDRVVAYVSIIYTMARTLEGGVAICMAQYYPYLCVGVSTVQQGEQGHKKPIGSAARLLDALSTKGLEALV